MSFVALMCLSLLSLVSLVALSVQGAEPSVAPPPPGEPLRVPAFTAYIQPDPRALSLSEKSGITGWTDPKQRVLWYGDIKTPGRLDVAISLHLPAGATSALQLTVAGKKLAAQATGRAGSAATTVHFGPVDIPTVGYYRFVLEGISRSGKTFGDVDALLLSGPATKDAHFNQKERRNAASIHLGYPLPEGTPATWFYTEVTAKTDPLWSYYMACGFHRGYFGIQVNSPTERRVIFSVWDSGSEAVDRGKVAKEDRVELLAKGPRVYASDFGNEGTGGHSHLKYNWKTGATYRFLVAAQPEGTSTVYSGYFYFPEKKQWGLIARFRAPKDGSYLRGLYSFNEDFGGANGDARRFAEFGNQWVKTAEGRWIELTTARFTHDPTGREDRKDYGAGIAESGRFYLSNGGFVAEPLRYGDRLQRAARGTPPGSDIVLPPEE